MDSEIGYPPPEQGPMMGVYSPSPLTPPGPQDDFFKYRVEGLDIIDEIQHQLRGEVFDTKTKKYVKRFDAWMNERGINKVCHIMYSLGLNKNTVLGCLDREQILYKCAMLKRNISLLIMQKHEEYEIDRSMWDFIVTIVVNTVHSALSRSEGGRESTQISTNAQRHDLYTHNEGDKQGIINKFFGRRG